MADLITRQVGSRFRSGQRVCIEIPVRISGSRVSVIRGETPPSAPFEENTRTVIVFPDGAVVRVSREVPAGQLVTATNLLSGHKVVCELLEAKGNAPTAGYAEIRFTERAPDFWGIFFPPDTAGDSGAVSRIRSLGRTGPGADPAPAVPALVPSNEGVPRAPALHSPHDSRSLRVVTGTLERTSIPAAFPAATGAQKRESTVNESLVTAISPPTSQSVVAEDVAPEATTALVIPVAESTASTGALFRDSSLDPSRTEQENWAPLTVRENKTGRRLALAGAMFVLLAVAAVTAGLSILRHYRGASETPTSPVDLSTAPAIPQDALQSEATPAADNERGATSPGQATALERPRSEEIPAQPGQSVVASPRKVEEQLAADLPERRATPKGGPASPRRRELGATKLSVPAMVPKTVVTSAAAPGPPPPVVGAGGTLPGNAANAVKGILAGSNSTALPGPEPPVSPRVGGRSQEPRLVSSVPPVYPRIARQRNVEGDVVLQAEVDQFGKVARMKVVSGDPLLSQAALDAVSRWRYEAATLNDQPVAWQLLVTVKFRLK